MKRLSCITLLLAAVLLTTACGVSKKVQQPTAGQLEALRRYVHPLRTVVPDGGDDSDLAILQTLLADARIVGLGEATHGSREIFQMKDRLVRYLARNMGFGIFSIEAAMPEAYEVNRYTIGGEGDAAEWIKGMYFWTWSTEEVREMVEWMRRYNTGEPKIAFTGFDMQATEGAFRELARHYADDETVRPMIDTLRQRLEKRMAYVDRRRPEPLSRREERYFLGEVDRLRNAMSRITLPDSTQAWLTQNLRILEQYIDLMKSSHMMAVSRRRDRYMAENLAWIRGQNPNSRIAAWAHNAHIEDFSTKMGGHLKEALGSNYATIGFALGEGTYTAFLKETGTVTSRHRLTPPPAGSYEQFLSLLEGDLFLVDLKRIKEEGRDDMKWFDRYHPGGYNIGAVVTEDRFLPAKLTRDFDYLIFIRNSTASRLLPGQNND